MRADNVEYLPTANTPKIARIVSYSLTAKKNDKHHRCVSHPLSIHFPCLPRSFVVSSMSISVSECRCDQWKDISHVFTVIILRLFVKRDGDFSPISLVNE